LVVEDEKKTITELSYVGILLKYFDVFEQK